MPGKPITDEALARDMSYVLTGTIFHQAFGRVFEPRRGAKVLEAGCGSGKFGLWYAIMGCDVTMIDIDPGVVAYAQALHEKLQPAFTGLSGAVFIELGNIHRLAKTLPGPWDFVFNEGLSHHWPPDDRRRQTSISQLVKVAKPGAPVAIMVSNAHCPAMMDYAKRVAHTYQSMPPTQVPFTRDELGDRLWQAGLRSIHVKPVEVNDWESAKTMIGWGVKP